ncbi:MAG TPA: hypothetical protein VJZ71_18665 [Phycisphaerae bacterium]|nr:hypothetical protein [Phycisphaerae bacterium]
MDEVSRNRLRGWTPALSCFLILWVTLLALGFERLLRDPGTFWHTVVGERILERHRLITTDPFSFTFEGRPWIAQQWLGECVMAVVHRAAGLDGLLLVGAMLIAATFAWLYGRLRRGGFRAPAAALLLALFLAGCSYHFHVRPHLVTIALTAWTLGLLVDIESGGRSARWLYALPPIMVLWTNVHGGALAGVLTTIVVLTAWAILSLRSQAKDKVGATGIRPAVCVVIAALCGASILVNPYGVEMVRVWTALSTSKVLPTIISEHGRVALGSPESLILGALAGIYLAMLLGCNRSDVRVTWLVPLLWLPLAFLRVRHGPLFVVTAAVVIAEMAPVCRWMQRPTLRRRFLGEALATRRASWPCVVVCGLPIVASLLIQMAGWRIPLIGAGWARLDADYWPIAATRAAKVYLRDRGTEARIFNDMLFAGYLIYQRVPAKVYIDDRCELYGDEFLLHFVDLLRNPSKIEGEAPARKIDLAMVRTGSRMAQYLTTSEAWTVLHCDETATLFLRAPAAAGSPAP